MRCRSRPVPISVRSCALGRERARVSLRAARDRRCGAARPAAYRARHRRDARVHAGRHPGHGQGDHARRAARRGRADDPRQHLSPDAASGRRADRASWRAAPVHGLAGADPDRLRRLSGDVARRAAHAGRGRRHVRLAPGRQPPSAHARARGRDPGAAGRDGHHGARRMHALPDRAGGAGGLDAPLDALGGAVQGGVSARARATACSASSRAASIRSCAWNRPRVWSSLASMAMRSAVSPWARARR